jgi:DNA-binding response OmpR family regulator
MYTPTDPPPEPPPPGRTLDRLWRSAGDWSPRVLVAEDDVEMRRLLVETLTREGLTVSEARDGAELMEIAVRTLQEDGSAPELVITDVRMPGRNGIEALRALRATLKSSAILVITAFGDEATRRQAGEVGAAAVLDKPFELSELCAAVARLLR